MEENELSDVLPQDPQTNGRRKSTGDIPSPFLGRLSLLQRAYRNLSNDGADSVEGYAILPPHLPFSSFPYSNPKTPSSEPLTQHEKNEILRTKWIQRTVELERLRKETAKLEARLDKSRDFWKDKHYNWQREFDALQDRNVELEDRNYEMWCALAERDQDARAQKKNVDALTARVSELERDNRELQRRLGECLERDAEFNSFFFGYIMKDKDDPGFDRGGDDGEGEGEGDFMSLETSSTDISSADADAPLHSIAKQQRAPAQSTQGKPLSTASSPAIEIQAQEVATTESLRRPTRADTDVFQDPQPVDFVSLEASAVPQDPQRPLSVSVPRSDTVQEPSRLASVSLPTADSIQDIKRLDSISVPSVAAPTRVATLQDPQRAKSIALSRATTLQASQRLGSIAVPAESPSSDDRVPVPTVDDNDLPDLSKRNTLANLREGIVNLSKQTTLSTLGEAGVGLLKQATFSSTGEGGAES